MKLVRAADNLFVFELGHREKELLLQVLKLYPRIPPAAHRLTKKGQLPDQDASQRLLEDALSEHRAENQRQLQALLAEPRRLAPAATGWHLTLSGGDLEWLLQVLNDVRVGSWLNLGAPETRIPPLTEENAPDLWAMELAGAFQMRFLESVEGKR
jgi:hypothetical protein